MTERQNWPTAQVRARAVRLAVVLPWVPVGQVLPYFRPGAHNLADGPGLRQLSKPPKARMKSQVVADHHQPARGPREFEQLAYARNRAAERLFYQNVRAGADRRTGRFDVQTGGIG